MVYKEVSTNLNFTQREKQTEAFWEENKIFEKSLEQSGESGTYTFYDGPPTANGKPHIGHVITRVIKDLIPRYRTMKGYYVPRKAGWDTHGLPVELEVERALGINGKDQIESYGMAPFIKKCKESVWQYKGMWEDFSKTVGYWVDMENPYVTYDNNFIESEWWALKQIWDRGLLYKGFKILPYCPRCGTPLSSHEVAQGYKDVKERSAIAKFKVKDEDSYFLAWTTTPWTLPSNVALCVNAQETYIKAVCGGEVYYLAKELANAVLGEEYEVIEELSGKDLEFKEYEPLFDFVSPNEKCFYITCDSYVTLTDGTGIVHIAPAFGEDDANVGRKYKLPFVQLVDAAGCMAQETDWAGVFCKDADKEILKSLKEGGKLFSAPSFEHSYPFCWRCDTPLIYYARESWFIKMTAVKDDLLRNNAAINWIPANIGERRFGDWLENVQDWGVSRNRYWGTPLNIWECKCGHRHSIGSVKELRAMSKNCPKNVELHRPYVDEVFITCTECGENMKRVPEVIDCWFDSGAMPFAQHHYPFENKDLFQSQFPADFISEAVDQTRGWFYSLLAISTLIFNEAPYKNVIVLGHVQDENGQKMSKTKGNAVDPFEALEQFGADPIRWYFSNNSAPWVPNKFYAGAVIEGQKKFFSTLWNTYAFFVLYANIDEIDCTKYRLERSKLNIMDKWLLSRLNSLVYEVDGHLENYRIQESTKQIQDFVDGLSNWYVRRCRERYWASDTTDDKISAYMTLYTALVTLSKLLAPITPFISEEIYQNLVCTIDEAAPKSVHLCRYPKSDKTFVDKELEKNMDLVLRVVTLGRAARNAANIKTRQPLAKIFVMAQNLLPQEYQKIILQELNIKEIELTSDITEFTDFVFKPQLKILGAKYGRLINEIRAALSELDGASAKAELDNNGAIKITISTGEISLSENELLIETKQREGFASFAEQGVTIVIDTAMTDGLIEEGFVREIVSKIQSMRKDAGFKVTDHIVLYQSGNDKIRGIIERNHGEIMEDTLTDEIICGELNGYQASWDINGEKSDFAVMAI